MRTLRITLALLLVFHGVALAGPGSFNLGWDDCPSGASQLDKSFACNTNSGAFTLIASFIAPSSVIGASGIVSTLHLQAGFTASMPPWWSMAPGQCRTGSLTASFDFTAGPPSCIDYWQGAASGSIVVDSPYFNRATITVTAALPAGSPLITSIPEGVEVYAFKAEIDAAKTTGPAACTGCLEPAVICLTAITITQPAGTPGGNLFIGTPAVAGFATWRGGLGPKYACDATPARNTTWGSIKSLYR